MIATRPEQPNVTVRYQLKLATFVIKSIQNINRTRDNHTMVVSSRLLRFMVQPTSYLLERRPHATEKSIRSIHKSFFSMLYLSVRFAEGVRSFYISCSLNSPFVTAISMTSLEGSSILKRSRAVRFPLQHLRAVVIFLISFVVIVLFVAFTLPFVYWYVLICSPIDMLLKGNVLSDTQGVGCVSTIKCLVHVVIVTVMSLQSCNLVNNCFRIERKNESWMKKVKDR